MLYTNLIEKIKAKKFTYGELESDIFSKYSRDEFQIIEQYLIEQYRLKMNYEPLMGYAYSANQQFNINREINRFGYQEQFLDESYETYGFFSGSTGWGWGVFSREKMIDYFIADYLKVNINNYSNVGINIFKIYNLMHKFRLEDKLPKRNIIYFGINEAYDIANNRIVFYSMRDERIKNNIKNFENYYRNIPHDISYILKELIKNMRIRVQDIKNAFGTQFVDRLPEMPAEKVLNMEIYNKNFNIITKIINEIHSMSSTNIFVLEPSLFDKNILTKYEKKLLFKKNMTDNILESTFHKLYDDLLNYFNQNNILYVDARESIKNREAPLYFDYCHPYEEATQIIGTFVAKKIKEII